MKNNYSSSDERKEWEKRWQVIKELRSACRTYRYKSPVRLKKDNLTGGNNYPADVMDVLLKNLQDEGCFDEIKAKDSYYEIINPHQKVIERKYIETEKIYKKYASKFQNRRARDLGINSRRINLEINREKRIVSRVLKNKSLPCTFHLKSGKNARFNYLTTIIDKDKVSGSKLKGTNTIQYISGEIKAINKKLRRDLRLSRDVIVNPNNGYEINKIWFEPVFV